MVERVFATLYSRMCMMMAHAGIHENINTCLWPECAATGTKLEIILVKSHQEKCAHDKFYGKIPNYAKYLRTFGEMGFLIIISTVK